ncbi:FAD-binding protein [Amphritea sp. 1_MG-2023]|uniref:electron transfer flavoprotein subunit alpha/FixB family protein n=1 Tax=Amphritea sp. 1_MG-2023 TaxID=3062670 RepID=UPI0026E16B3D|nr:FAD-binding protein [Amphritea sp. 1_MG-2023]MDO6563304.1 FAD-binding protein [Amphritea sp. 1_MG-2023]
MTILVIAEHDNVELKPVTLNVIQAATEVAKVTGKEIEVLVAGFDCRAVADQAVKANGIGKVLLVDDEAYSSQLAESMSSLIIKIAAKYSHILAPASTSGKNFMPRVAALLDVAQISEIISVESENTFKRPIYAGNAIATVQSGDTKKVMTVRGTAFNPVDSNEHSIVEIVGVETPDVEKNTGSRHVADELVSTDRPELTSARVVISGGRGMANGDNFKLLDGIADKLGAAVGASRAAVDAGFVSNDMQVGQTGKIVAPELYIAVGISGAIQHLAGMKDSKVIVAINKDEDAPIFSVADYGVVIDLFEALPLFEQEL